MSTAGLYSRKNPFPARLLRRINLCGPGSEKDTRHIELSLAGSGLTYEVGDSLGVFGSNDPTLVEEILSVTGLDPEAPVATPEGSIEPLREALLHRYVVTHPDRKLLAALLAKGADGDGWVGLLAPERKNELDAFLRGREVIDFLLAAPGVRFTPEELVGTLRKLQPRLYSIASSLRAHPDEAHLTVAAVRYESFGRVRKGVCSTFLCERLSEGLTVPVFVHVARGFRPPADPSCDMIMVGPGTGVAPFRAFLEERRATGATGRNWLFFGEHRAAANFFYREEFERALADGVLTRFDTAFSRDQDRKIYVQHRLLEKAAEVWRWIDGGAEFFVCGEAHRMATDVEEALVRIVAEQGGRSPEAAREYVERMRHDKRYKRDVY